MSQINTELGRASNSQISLDTAENGGYGAINTNSSSRPSSNNPAAISEWWGYNHNACVPYGTYAYDFCQGCGYYYMYHDGSCGYYWVLQDGNSGICGCGQAYACEDYWGNCSLYQSPCWEIGLSECNGGGGAIQ
jgi:hypothetical protein